MMQKNLSCKNLKAAQKNMIYFSIILVAVNVLFLYLGALIYQYADINGISSKGDDLFVDVIKHGQLGSFVFVLFLLGLISAAYSSADSALTSLTTSFRIDILGVKHEKKISQFFSMRTIIHIFISILLFVVILKLIFLDFLQSLSDKLNKSTSLIKK